MRGTIMPRRLRTTPRVLLTIALVAFAAQTDTAQQLRSNGVDLSYVEAGTGPAVVFVHGAVADLRFWEPQREAFARRHRFVAYTLRYHGTGAWPDDGKQYTADVHAADLAAFISGLKAGPVHLVGLSYGGLIAALVATREPALVRSLTLAEPALFSLLADQPEDKPALEAWSTAVTPVVAAVKAGDTVSATRRLLGVVNGDFGNDFDSQPAALRQVLLDNARTLSLLFTAPPVTISCDTLRSVKIPTLLIRGEHTPQFFSRTNDAVGRCIGASQKAVIPTASHVMSSQNAAAFNQAVLSFVDKHR
jgi:pimeloyl-ACP methyl ester carboxylesterase